MHYKHDMPYWNICFLIIVGIMIFIESNFIISISHDQYLWWQVLTVINKSPYTLIIAYMMVVLSFMLTGVGVFLLFTKDRKSDQFN